MRSDYDKFETCCPKSNSKAVKNVNVWLTEDCCFKCIYCYEGQDKRKNFMTKETGRQVIDWLLDNRISGSERNLSINFFGGEPLLNQEVIEDMVFYGLKQSSKVDKNLTFSMTTNGYLFNEELLKFYKRFNVGILLSIDGGIDSMVKTRGFPNNPENLNIVKKVIDNAVLILRYYPDITGRLTLANFNVKNLKQDVLFLVGLGFKHISAHIITDGVGEFTEQDTVEYENQLNELYDWFINYLIYHKFIPYQTIWKRYMRLRQPWNQEYITRASPCGAGKGFLGISYTGDIYPCHRFVIFPEFKLGNVFEYELNNNLRNTFYEFRRPNIDKCLNCQSKTCYYQCYASNYAKFKNIFQVNDVQCKIDLIEEKFALRLVQDSWRLNLNVNYNPRAY